MTELQTKEQVKHNLNTYYILPLLKLNVMSWGEDNFISSQVTKFGEVVVFIKNSLVAGDYYNHDNYLTDIDEEDSTTMIVYSIPEVFLTDYQYFLDSKYSKMSIFAKDLIKAHATANGLMWKKESTEEVTDSKGRVKKVTFVESSRCLMALDLLGELKEALEAELDVKIKEGAELQDRIEDKEIIKLN
jgi:hypothetical protein